MECEDEINLLIRINKQYHLCFEQTKYYETLKFKQYEYNISDYVRWGLSNGPNYNNISINNVTLIEAIHSEKFVY